MKVYLTSFLLLLHLSINAQFLTNDEIFKRTAKQSVICPPEKVYLHTDRNNYVAGEKIWMRAHVADGIAHIPMKLSRFVYVTLQNPFGRIAFSENVMALHYRVHTAAFLAETV